MNPSTRLVIDPDRPQPEAIQEAAQRLRRGDIALIPTDTVYGLAAHPAVPGAMERLAAAKVRDPGKPIAYLVDGVQVPERYGAVLGTMGTALAQAYWPGPLTLVVPVGERTEGFRMPRHAATLALLTACGGALRVTSANRSGDSEARTVDEALAALPDGMDFALDAGCVGEQEPSTVVRIEGNTVEVLRDGAVSREELNAVMRSEERFSCSPDRPSTSLRAGDPLPVCPAKPRSRLRGGRGRRRGGEEGAES